MYEKGVYHNHTKRSKNVIIKDMKKRQRKKKRNILEQINGPHDVRKLSQDDLNQLAGELRCFLIDTITRHGGHYGSNLGVVELTVALHHVFRSPKDKIIWDVGHQAYAHKVLTGRRDQLHTIRQKGGLAPFPSRDESVHDAFGVGHSSTSVSAAIGMALAHEGEADAPRTVAVIGDGALTGGMALEALNHGGDKHADVLVILNDNKMSISPNVGGLHQYLTRLISSPAYTTVREKGKNILSRVPTMQEFVRRTEAYTKGMITPGTLFEELGWGYYGPIDGHDIVALVKVLKNLNRIRGPRLLHIVTQKGKGCLHAERDGLALHAVSATVDKVHQKKQEKKQTYTDVFSAWICDMATQDEHLHAITPAMREGSGLVAFEERFPARYHDVGIAEQHALTFAAGLACEGKKPVVAIYATFLQRAYDQLIHDIALQNLDVLLAVDRGGVVGPDGATHAGNLDLSFLRCVPRMVIAVPASGEECTQMLSAGYAYKGPVAVRYPRGSVHAVAHTATTMTIGKAEVLFHGEKTAILAWGAMVALCEDLAKELNVTLVNMRFVKPLDGELLEELAKTHKNFITIEDNVVAGGAGSAVNEFVLNHNIDVTVKNLGLPDAFQAHGSREELLADAGLTTEHVRDIIQAM